nr:sugar ABC transporter ATP-binding protein [Rhodococcus sp. (in: high G+C Gram-positive bacteria)]
MTDPMPLVKIQGLTKAFGGQHALQGVDLTIMRGEVHGLLGENGSGKSTLIKILSGFHASDDGILEVGGKNIPLPLLPGQHLSIGFEFVHQDLGLVPSLSVTENFVLGEIAASRSVAYSWRAARQRAVAAFARYEVNIDPDATVDSIRPVDRAMLAIVRAVEGIRDRAADGYGATLLVLDEPTVFLPRQEVGQLFSLVRRITSEGASVLFVSHDLDEVMEITDSVTVLRDGRTSGTVVTADTTGRDLVKMIVGRELADNKHIPTKPATERDVVLSVRNLSNRALEDVSFDLHAGEVLGLAGLAGSGYEDVVYSLFGAGAGAGSGAEGTVTAEGRTVDIGTLTPRRAMSLGMAFVPGDRKNLGSVGTLSLGENMNLTVLGKYFRGWRLRHGSMRDNVRRLVDEFDVRPAVPELEYGLFSGGNQQKALMAKWQQIQPKLLLLHEPTQGVDVGARQQIFEMIRGSKSTGATICASSEYEQLEIMCDRVAIFVRGRLVAFLTGDEVTKARMADLCHGQGATADPAALP